MKFYSEAGMEWTMKVQEVILRALGKRITWWQADKNQQGRGSAPALP